MADDVVVVQKQALLDYLEYQLVTFAEGFERHVDPDSVGRLYEDLFMVLNDVDEILDTEIEIQQGPFEAGPVDKS